MKYVVFVKQVPDTAEMTVDENGSLVREGVPSIMDPYSESALSCILSSRRDGDEVIAVTMGPPSAKKTLRRCIALGADSATLLSDPAFAGADTYATARVLTSYVTKYACDADLIVFGRQTIDGGTGQVPSEVAQMVGVQIFSYVTDMGVDGMIAVTQDYGDMERVCEVPKGSVVSFGDVDVVSQLPSVNDVIRGMDSDITVLNRIDLGLGLYSVGLKGSFTEISSTDNVRKSRKNRMVEIRDPSSAAQFIIDKMKVI